MTLAEELNETLAGSVAARLLSDMGKRMYFPKGILSQSAEAGERAHRFNATIGMAYEDGEPLILDAVRASMPGLSPYEAVAYASTGGVPELRKRWKASLEAKNPSLKGKTFSLPVVVPGLTAAVSYVSDLFLEPGDGVVVPDLHWPNYRLIVEGRRTAVGLTYPLFAGGGFNVAGFEAKLREGAKARAKVAAILNFPNNPTGYSPTLAEADAIVAALKRVADEGNDILVITDDAYFGLDPGKLDALVKKMMGVIRSSVSNSNGPGQHILLKALGEDGYEAQKARYRRVRDFLATAKLPASLSPLPFNSGYFMSFECRGISAEALRLRLLDKGIGTIALGEKHLRIAFSCVEVEKIDELYGAILEEARSLEGKA